MPGTKTAAGGIARQPPFHPQCDQRRAATTWCLPLPPQSGPESQPDPASEGDEHFGCFAEACRSGLVVTRTRSPSRHSPRRLRRPAVRSEDEEASPPEPHTRLQGEGGPGSFTMTSVARLGSRNDPPLEYVLLVGGPSNAYNGYILSN